MTKIDLKRTGIERPSPGTRPWKCSTCRRCNVYTAGSAAGMCIYGGPFAGFERAACEPYTISVDVAEPDGDRQVMVLVSPSGRTFVRASGRIIF